jgi:hypothetical protein
MSKVNFSKIRKEQETFKNSITQEKAELLLSTFSNHIINSKKPLWIEETKKTCNKLIPTLDIKEVSILLTPA